MRFPPPCSRLRGKPRRNPLGGSPFIGVQNLGWYANRLRRMSGGEIVHRVGKVARAYGERLAPRAEGGEPARLLERTGAEDCGAIDLSALRAGVGVDLRRRRQAVGPFGDEAVAGRVARDPVRLAEVGCVEIRGRQLAAHDGLTGGFGKDAESVPLGVSAPVEPQELVVRVLVFLVREPRGAQPRCDAQLVARRRIAPRERGIELGAVHVELVIVVLGEPEVVVVERAGASSAQGTTTTSPACSSRFCCKLLPRTTSE